ncbi:MAG TPA: Na+/H+ antiporter NhaC family protein [Candidatus Mailhella merdigallinarum]|uniref:Na+/H+ antiporter NhaC family protein n=1 Tax=Candidatus Mailhella merdigallinarum TaxID=2838658 RepID=A0A9D2HDQ8_9BACT|nr:MAG: sodium:proton antiporter [Desulfovibrionaceae bacterium]HJA08547.1 Na+/H+ antiporter NhaC family protein [Candidatus Mailhella merdigallinarum]
MEPYYAGWLSILPPVIAITLALLTKEVLSSLLIGILSGTIIYALNVPGVSLLVGPIEIAFNVMVDKIDMNIIIFCSLLGALVYVISMAGGTAAYGKWAASKIKSRRSALLSTSALGAFVFIDDYFNCLTVGTVMKPVTDAHGVSRAKLAYIIDATAAPICIIAPISSWAAAVGSNLKATGAFDSDFAAFVSTIPYNFYALLSLIMIVVVSLTRFDFGPMRAAEKRAEQGDLGALSSPVVDTLDADRTRRGGILDMLLPIASLIVFSVLGLLYSGGYWGEDEAYHTLAAAFGNTTAAQALVWGSCGALIVALLLFVPRGLVSFRGFMDGVVEGMKTMLTANIILVLAWTISGVCRDLLQTPQFVESIVAGGQASGALLPAIVFVVAGFLSFSTGTAWGTFGILIPIVVPVAQAIDPNLLVVTLSATLAGSVFGDHCSPISDTTILSSAGAGCNHVEHVSTQLPYALVVAGACFAGYTVAGVSGGSLVLSLGTAIAVLAALIIGIRLFHPALRTENAQTA